MCTTQQAWTYAQVWAEIQGLLNAEAANADSRSTNSFPGPIAVPVHLMGPIEEEVVALDSITGASRDAWVAVIANDLLLEGQVPWFGIELRDHWLLPCHTGSSHPSCTTYVRTQTVTVSRLSGPATTRSTSPRC